MDSNTDTSVTEVTLTTSQYQELLTNIQTQNQTLMSLNSNCQKIVDGISWLGAVLIICVVVRLVWWFFDKVLFSGL